MSIFENRRTVDGEWTELSYKKCENRGTCCRTLIICKNCKNRGTDRYFIGFWKTSKGSENIVYDEIFKPITLSDEFWGAVVFDEYDRRKKPGIVLRALCK